MRYLRLTSSVCREYMPKRCGCLSIATLKSHIVRNHRSFSQGECRPNTHSWEYSFNKNGELVDKTNKKFLFDYFDEPSKNQKRYEEVGEAITHYVYTALEKDYKMERKHIPFDATPDEPRGFFFASENAEKTEDKLLVLIHGSGVVRAGQWSRRIIINDNLMDGSQIPYIEQAYKDGYEVVVLNTNYNNVEGQGIRGSSTAEKHAIYVWDQYVKLQTKAKHIAITAHSYGGTVALRLGFQRRSSFLARVFTIGFTDSFHSIPFWPQRKFSKFLRLHARNWVASDKPLDTLVDEDVTEDFGDCARVSAGDARHEWTASKSMNSMFKFFRDQYDQRIIEQPKFLSFTDIEEEDEDEGQIDESHEKKFRKLEKPKLKDN